MTSRLLATTALLFLCLSIVTQASEGYREKGRFTPPNPPKKKQVGQMAEKAFSYPVIANGRLYIRDLETLWVYDIKAR